MTFVVLQVVGQFALVAQSHVVNERNAGEPVAMFQFAMALDVILSARKIPHEIAPVHEITLVGKEEVEILQL